MRTNFVLALLIILPSLLLTNSNLAAQSTKPLKVFISVDMEGLTGVVNANDVNRRNGFDYQYFREVMAKETNAAIQGAIAAGATEILVRDSHGAKNNLIPSQLDKRAKLLRGATVGPKNMMESIDESYDAVIFVGYHARAGTPSTLR